MKRFAFWLVCLLCLFLVPLAPTEIKLSAQDNESNLSLVAAFGARGRPVDIEWSPDSSVLATSGYNGIYLYDDLFNDIGYLAGARGYVGEVGWNTDGTLLAGAIATDLQIGGAAIFGNTNIFYVWDVSTQELIQEFAIPADQITVEFDESSFGFDEAGFGTINATQNFVFSPNNQQLAVVSSVQTSAFLSIWDIPSGGFISILPLPVVRGAAVEIAWSPDNDSIAFVESDSLEATDVNIWDFSNIPSAIDVGTAINGLRWNNDGISVQSPSEIISIDTETQTIITTVELASPFTSPDGRFNVEIDFDAVQILDAQNGTVIDTLTLEDASRFSNRFEDAFWTDQNKLIALVGRRADSLRIFIWDAETQALTAEFKRPGFPFFDPVLSPDERILTSDLNGVTLLNISLENGSLIAEREVNLAPLSGLSLHPNETLLTTGQVGDGDLTGNLLTWDINTERVSYRPSHPGYPFSVAWSPDGSLLAVGAQSTGTDADLIEDGPERASIGIYNIDHEEVARLYVSSYLADQFYRIRWSPDGRLLAGLKLSNQSGIFMLYVWDIATNALLWERPFLTWDIAWTQDNNLIAIGEDTIEQLNAASASLKHFLGTTGEEIAVVSLASDEIRRLTSRHSITVHPLNPDVLIFDNGNNLMTFSISSGEELFRQSSESRTASIYRPLVVSPDGQFIVRDSSNEKTLLQPELSILRINETGTELTLSETFNGFNPNRLIGVAALDWKGNSLAALGGYGDIWVWDTSNVE